MLLFRVISSASAQRTEVVTNIAKPVSRNATAEEEIATLMLNSDEVWYSDSNVLDVLNDQSPGTAIDLPGGDVVIVTSPYSNPTEISSNRTGGRVLADRCTMYGKGSCHRSDYYDDFSWDTYLSLRRVSDGYKSNEGWSKTPTISGFTFPINTLVDITVTCERTGTRRTKCPFVLDAIGFWQHEWPCGVSLVRYTGNVFVFCQPV